jgi:hypothetical protein
LVGGFQYLITLTAPGDRQHRLPSGAVCPCTPLGGTDLPKWNASHSDRWNHFRTILRRQYPQLEFFRAVEVQDGKRLGQISLSDGLGGRGALHDHFIAWSPVPLTKVQVRKLAITAGFGHSVDVQRCDPGSRAAASYVTKSVTSYVTKAIDQRSDVPWFGPVRDVAGKLIANEHGEVVMGPTKARYRTWSSSRGWGCKMVDARAVARAYAVDLAEREDELAARYAVGYVVGLLGGEIVDPSSGPT